MDHLAKRLRKTIQLILQDEIGIYTLANKAQTPAIAVRADSERLPTGTKVKGMEVIVSRYADQEPVLQYTLQPMVETWTVWLVGWDNEINLMDSAHLLLEAYPGSEFTKLTVPKSWGPTNQVKVELRDPWFAPDEFDVKDLDGGYFHPILSIPATEKQLIVDSGNLTHGATQDQWIEPKPVDGGVFA